MLPLAPFLQDRRLLMMCLMLLCLQLLHNAILFTPQCVNIVFVITGTLQKIICLLLDRTINASLIKSASCWGRTKGLSHPSCTGTIVKRLSRNTGHFTVVFLKGGFSFLLAVGGCVHMPSQLDQDRNMLCLWFDSLSLKSSSICCD